MPAVRGAAADVKHKLLALAGDVFEALGRRPRADATATSGRRTAALDQPYTEVTAKLGHASIDGSGMRGPNPDGFRANTFGCQIAQVAVDPGTGEVFVEGIWAVHDIGRVINPLGASSQVEGGILQGMAYALSRGARLRPHDRRAGQRDARRLQGADHDGHAADHGRVRADARRAAEHRRRQGPRRAADHPHRRGDRERVPPRHGRRPRALPLTPRAGPGAAGMSTTLRAARQPRRGARTCWRSPVRGRSAAAPTWPASSTAASPPPATIVDLQALGLGGDRGRPASGVRIGGTTTLADVAVERRARARGRSSREAAARCRLAAPAQPGHRRRQPLPAHALLVLPRPRVELLARRRRHLLRPDRRAPQAQPAAGRLHLGAPVRPRAGAAGLPRRPCTCSRPYGERELDAGRPVPAPDRAEPVADRPRRPARS